MRTLMLLPCIASFVFLASCHAEPQGMSRKIDGSSDEAAKKSVEKLSTELSPSDFQKFTQAYGKLAMRWAFASAFTPGADKDSKAFLRSHLINSTCTQKGRAY
jgi:hypothetical protein